MSDRHLGIILILLASVGYALLPIFARSIYALSPYLNPMDVALWRFVLAVPVIWLIVVVQQRTRKRPPEKMPHRHFPLLGAIYAASAFLTFAGLEKINASLFIVLFFTYPAMVAVISYFMGQRLSRFGWLALALTLAGIVFTLPDLSQPQDIDFIGVGLILGSAFFVAIYFVVNGRWLRNVQNMSLATAWIITWTLIALMVTLPFLGLQLPDKPQTWLSIIGMAAISTTLPILGIGLAIQLIGAAQSAIITSIEPVIAMLLAMLLLGEIVLPGQWIGAIFIIAGVLLLQIPTKTRKKPA